MKIGIVKLLAESKANAVFELVTKARLKYPENWFYKPSCLEVEITNDCNLDCWGCGLKDEPSKPGKLLSGEDFVRIINDAGKLGFIAYSITGGEPFLLFEEVKKIIGLSGPDLYKLNTNGSFFKTEKETLKYFNGLKACGFAGKNKKIKPVLVISLGQQNKAGVPLANAVNAALGFYKVFRPEEAVCSFNVTDVDLGYANGVLAELKKEYRSIAGKCLSPEFFPARVFSLAYLPTIKRMGLYRKEKILVKDLIDRFKKDFLSWKCFNTFPPPGKEMKTLLPRCLVRPNGNLYACPGFNHVFRLGNLANNSLSELLAKANNNPVFRKVITEGLPGLYALAVEKNSALSRKKLSVSYLPCDVCDYLKKTIEGSR